jgi:hypothetical protein
MDFSFTVETTGAIQNYLISPLLFLPFVDYVISNNRSFINLHFSGHDDALLFECQSPCAPQSNNSNPESVEFAGICRRLALLYQTGYTLETKFEHDMELIQLKIEN